MQKILRREMITMIFASIFFLAAFFRLSGVNWDQNQHLHPDERFLTMVTQGIEWPKNIHEYFDTTNSPLNPHNKGFGFYVYGTFPVFLTKLMADLLHGDDYGNITLIGRQLSALFDLGTVVLVYLVAKNLISKSEFLISNQIPNPNEVNPRNNFFRHLDIGGYLGQLEIRSIRNLFPLLSMFFYAASVLPIQLSHFYAVETYLTFFITLSFYMLFKIIYTKEDIRFSFLPQIILLGVSVGLAVASKISAILFVTIIGLFFLYKLVAQKRKLSTLLVGVVVLIIGIFTIRLTYPYLFSQPNVFNFSLNHKVLDNWKQLKSFDDPNGGFPPGVQWITTKPYIYPLKNLVLWGLGLPLGIVTVIGVLYSLLHCFIAIIPSLRRRGFRGGQQLIGLSLITLWILLLFTYQGGQFSKNMRYLVPIYPFLAIVSAWALCEFINAICLKRSRNEFGMTSILVYSAFCILILLYPTSFLSIYSHPHSRVAASEWIYANIPAGAHIAQEHWDDGLPLNFPNHSSSIYTGVEFPLYYPDTAADKWSIVTKRLGEVDYISLSSNRLYGSIMTVPQKFPATYRYYQALFDGTLGFEKQAEFTSRPNLPLPFVHGCIHFPGERYGIIAKTVEECPSLGISLVDDYADESFTVYDHPKVLIFKKVKSMKAEEYQRLLNIQ